MGELGEHFLEFMYLHAGNTWYYLLGTYADTVRDLHLIYLFYY